MTVTPDTSRFSRYERVAVSVLNCLLTILVFNLLLALIYHFNDLKHGVPRFVHPAEQEYEPQEKQVDLAAYEGVPPQDVHEVLRAFTAWFPGSMVFDPWSLFTPTPYHSTFLNVDGAGWQTARRVVPTASAGPEVWVFGGSTGFGWDVADAWSMPSCLQQELQQAGPVRVVNYARPGYYSSQELALFIQLLKHRPTPRQVVFLDGFNDCFFHRDLGDVPALSDTVGEALEASRHPRLQLWQFSGIPMVRLALEIKSHFPGPAVARAPEEAPESAAERIVKMYGDNVELEQAICRRFGIRPCFFWQPVSFYHYNRVKVHTFMPPVLSDPALPRVCDLVRQRVPVVFLGDLARSYPGAVYLDMCHYTPGFNRFLAGAMARQIASTP
ncbi:MAG: hypothetical protein ACYCW6_24800 [Candidatus Xenobia bacterium]